MQVYGLVGNPVGHSLSPPMHEAAYEAAGIDARYVTFEPAPGDVERAIDGAAALGVAGLNVTVPFKRDVLEVVEPDPLAARIGAVNTIDFGEGADPAGPESGSGGDGTADDDGDEATTDGDRPTGHNTDAEGARRALTERGGADLDGATAVVVGAGGAGRAVAFALAEAGADVGIANRTASRAVDLADDVAGATAARAEGHGLDAAGDLLADADVLVNATTVGMEEDASPVPAGALHGGLTVLDAVYRPLETRLLKDAAAAGATTVDGAWMLLYQGAAAFELWTGREAPVAAMNEALRERL